MAYPNVINIYKLSIDLPRSIDLSSMNPKNTELGKQVMDQQHWAIAAEIGCQSSTQFMSGN